MGKYKNIEEANTPTKLRNAFRKRAQYLRNLLQQIEEEDV